MKDKVHTIEIRDIVKENAHLYRDTELTRLNNELITNFKKHHQEEIKNCEKVFDNLAQ